jgi:hypothetical protein
MRKNESQNNKYCKTIRYSLIETTPYFLKHKIPIIELFNNFLYWLLVFYYFLSNFISGLLEGIDKGLKYLKGMFQNKKTLKGQGADIGFDLDLIKEEKINFNNIYQNIDNIPKIPNYLIKKKEIEIFL